MYNERTGITIKVTNRWWQNTSFTCNSIHTCACAGGICIQSQQWYFSCIYNAMYLVYDIGINCRSGSMYSCHLKVQWSRQKLRLVCFECVYIEWWSGWDTPSSFRMKICSVSWAFWVRSWSGQNKVCCYSSQGYIGTQVALPFAEIRFTWTGNGMVAPWVWD